MAYVQETPESGSTTWDRASSTYQVVANAHGYSSSATAKAAIASWAPSSVIVDGFPLSHRVIRGEPIQNANNDTSDSIHQFTIDYSSDDQDSGSNDTPGSLTYSFDVSGQTITRTEALSQVGYGETIAALVSTEGGAINVEDGEAKGVEIIVPQATYTETHIFSADTVTTAWFRTKSQYVGKTNSAVFRGFLAEELLLIGMPGEQQGAGSWRITFTWQVEWTTNNNYTLNGVSTAVPKPGHRYIWFLYAKAENAEAGAKKILVPRAMSAYVAKVYETIDYNGLGIT